MAKPKEQKKDQREGDQKGRRKFEKPFRNYVVGAPTLYEPDRFPERVVAMGRLGYSFVLIATDLAVIRGTLYDWAGRHPEFATALLHAREFSLGYYEKLGLDGITAGREFNDRQFMNMAGNLHPREYRNRVEHTGAVAALDFGRMTDEQLTRIKSGEHPYVVLAETRDLAAPPLPDKALGLAAIPPLPAQDPNELTQKTAPADDGTGAADDGDD